MKFVTAILARNIREEREGVGGRRVGVYILLSVRYEVSDMAQRHTRLVAQVSPRTVAAEMPNHHGLPHHCGSVASCSCLHARQRHRSQV